MAFKMPWFLVFHGGSYGFGVLFILLRRTGGSKGLACP